MLGSTISYQQSRAKHSANTMTKSELSALMSGMTQAECDYIYAFFGEETGKIRMYAYAYQKAIATSLKNNWFRNENDRLEIIHAMASVAVNEVLDATCKTCRGTGILNLKICQRCNGIGMARFSDRHVASELHINPSNYKRRWRERYDSIYLALDHVKCSVHFKLRMNGKDD